MRITLIHLILRFVLQGLYVAPGRFFSKFSSLTPFSISQYPFTTVWATRGRLWQETFPNFRVDILAASVIFYLPVLRDIAMWAGCRDGMNCWIKYQSEKLLPCPWLTLAFVVTRTSIKTAFAQKRSIMLVPGGEREMRENRPESKDVVLITRHKGFVRLALQHGTPLVPVFGFGESRLLDNFRAKKLQEYFAKRIFYGMPHSKIESYNDSMV